MKEAIDSLTQDLLLMRYMYYYHSTPVVTDYLYDLLERLLVRLEHEAPEYRWSNSPSITVGDSRFNEEYEKLLPEFKKRWVDGLNYKMPEIT